MDHETLIVCKNQTQIVQVIDAFHIEADYIPYRAMITGRGYRKIIVFRTTHFTSVTEEKALQYWLCETIQTSLKPKGVYLEIDC